MKVSKLSIIIICSLIFMIGSVFFFNYVIKKDKENKALEEQKEEHKPIDLSDASNVPVIDGKLGDDIVITQGYLMRYVTKKRSIWYQSSGYVQDITSKNGQSVIKISDSLSSKEYILLTIDSDKNGNYDLEFTPTIKYEMDKFAKSIDNLTQSVAKLEQRIERIELAVRN